MSETNPFKTFDNITEIDGIKYYVLSVAIPKERLAMMIKNYDYALTTINALSFYFNNCHASEALKKLKDENEMAST